MFMLQVIIDKARNRKKLLASFRFYFSLTILFPFWCFVDDFWDSLLFCSVYIDFCPLPQDKTTCTDYDFEPLYREELKKLEKKKETNRLVWFFIGIGGQFQQGGDWDSWSECKYQHPKSWDSWIEGKYWHADELWVASESDAPCDFGALSLWRVVFQALRFSGSELMMTVLDMDDGVAWP